MSATVIDCQASYNGLLLKALLNVAGPEQEIEIFVPRPLAEANGWLPPLTSGDRQEVKRIATGELFKQETWAR
jgi:hypothetical protein